MMTNGNCTATAQGHVLVDRLRPQGGHDSYYCFAAEDDGEQAATYEEVMKIRYKDEWISDMKSEIKALQEHES